MMSNLESNQLPLVWAGLTMGRLGGVAFREKQNGNTYSTCGVYHQSTTLIEPEESYSYSISF